MNCFGSILGTVLVTLSSVSIQAISYNSCCTYSLARKLGQEFVSNLEPAPFLTD